MAEDGCRIVRAIRGTLQRVGVAGAALIDVDDIKCRAQRREPAERGPRKIGAAFARTAREHEQRLFRAGSLGARNEKRDVNPRPRRAGRSSNTVMVPHDAGPRPVSHGWSTDASRLTTGVAGTSRAPQRALKAATSDSNATATSRMSRDHTKDEVSECGQRRAARHISPRKSRRTNASAARGLRRFALGAARPRRLRAARGSAEGG